MKKSTLIIAMLLSALLIVTGCTGNPQNTGSPEITNVFPSPGQPGDPTADATDTATNEDPAVTNTPQSSPEATQGATPDNSVAPVISWDTATLDQLDNTAEGWGLPMKTGGAVPEVPSKTANLFKKYSAFCMGDPTQKKVYLTFDCGYENGETTKILDALKAKDAKAVFFVTKSYVTSSPDIVQRMVDEGHELGNHTVTHPNLTKVSYDKFKTELLDLNEYVKEHYGVQMRYLRPPEGVFSERTLAATQMLNMSTILWDFAYKDWDPADQPGADYAFEKVTKHIHNGSILLLHAVSSSNAQALPRIIDELRAQGYIVSPLDV